MELVTVKIRKVVRKILQHRAVEQETTLWKVIDKILRDKLIEDGDLSE